MHVARDSGQLFISKPIVGRASGRLSVQLTRRITKPDGSFGGVAVASLDPGYFTAFYGSLDLGKESVISITGSDGVVRANSPVSGAVAAQAPGGPAPASDNRATDDVARIVSTRSLKDYPLTVSVGLSLDEVLADYRQRWRNHVLAGGFATLVIVAFALLLLAVARRQLKFARSLARGNAELSLASATNANLAAIIESSTDAIVSRTLERKILTWNMGAEALFGWRAAEIIGESSDILVPLDHQHEVSRNAVALEQFGTISAYDSVRLNRDGKRIDVSVMLSLMRDRSGEVSGVAVIMRDITGRKVAERALQNLTVELERKVTERTASLHAANEHLQSFAFSVSHDLRAPLRAIDGFAQALDESIVDLDAANRERIYRMRGSTKRMATLIDSLLQLSRLGQVQIAAEPHDVSAMVNGVTEEIRAEYPNVTFKSTALGASDGDPSLLRQVWVNLIGNAAKFSSKTGNPMVEIDRVEHAGEQIFVVKDNGAGFDMQYASKLFGLFQRMHRQDEFPGTGAGLAIVKRIVELHGGRIWAESDTGKGASFYFTLNPKLVVKSTARGPAKGHRSIPG